MEFLLPWASRSASVPCNVSASFHVLKLPASTYGAPSIWCVETVDGAKPRTVSIFILVLP